MAAAMPVEKGVLAPWDWAGEITDFFDHSRRLLIRPNQYSRDRRLLLPVKLVVVGRARMLFTGKYSTGTFTEDRNRGEP